MSLVTRFLLIPIIISNCILLLSTIAVEGSVVCSETADCEKVLRVGSKCVNGLCTNPFVEGCFKAMLGDDFASESQTDFSASALYGGKSPSNLPPTFLGAVRGRVCNSDDKKIKEDDETISSLPCLENEFGYFEIRIHNSNWESSIFVAWIIQIILMEVLKVPVTVGLNSNTTAKSSFYSPSNVLEYSKSSYPYDALRTGVEMMPSFDNDENDNDGVDTSFIGDFNETNCEATDEDCVHVLPEVWSGQEVKLQELISDQVVEQVDSSGQVGKIGWFIPGAVAKKDPSLMSHYGLQGEINRAKLAATFRRPTTWSEYCEEVSIDNCTTPDTVAQHYPNTTGRAVQYFEENLYTGYFRILPENNCTLFPDSCTGYFVGPLCSWTSYVDAQLYWNNVVGLKMDGPSEVNHGYGYSGQREIWRAANATQSPVIMWWWQPDGMIQEFASSEWNFQMILLPTVTESCYEGRVNADDRCHESITVRRGSNPHAACDNKANELVKVISLAVRDQTLTVEKALRSPGYEFLKALKISDLEVQSLLNTWMSIDQDRYGNDGREAVCSWVVQNVDSLVGFIPHGYPRTIVKAAKVGGVLIYVAWVVAILGGCGILVTAGSVYKHRKTKVFVYAQVTFVYIILLGFLLVTIGGFLHAFEPTDYRCMARSWLTSLGFSTVLAAILVKMSTINRIMQSSKKRNRIKVSNHTMMVTLGCLLMINLVFLIAWTLISPMRATETLALPNDGEPFEATISSNNTTTRNAHTIVETKTICRSRQLLWPYALEAWHSLLLFIAAILAFQSRGVLPNFNESKSVGTMIYSQFFFMVVRWIVFWSGQTMLITTSTFGASMGLLYVLDTVCSTTIYVIPKCFNARKNPSAYDPRFTSSSNNNNNTRISFDNSQFGNSRSQNPGDQISVDSGGDLSVKCHRTTGGKRSNFDKMMMAIQQQEQNATALPQSSSLGALGHRRVSAPAGSMVSIENNPGLLPIPTMENKFESEYTATTMSNLRVRQQRRQPQALFGSSPSGDGTPYGDHFEKEIVFQQQAGSNTSQRSRKSGHDSDANDEFDSDHDHER